MRFFIIALVIFTTIPFFVCANEIDLKDKSGWQISIGIGLHSLSFDEDYKESSNGITTSFQAGYLFKNGVSVYYDNNVKFYNSDYYDELFATGITGLGLSYPLNDLFYISGLYGYAIDRSIFQENSDPISTTGYGYGVTLGYIVSENFSIEINYMNLNFDEAETSYENYSIDTGANALSVITRYTF